MITYTVRDVTHDKDIEIRLPDPVPLVTPEGATLMVGLVVVSALSAVAVPAIPVVVTVGKTIGIFGLGWGQLAAWSVGAEAASMAVGALALKAHRVVFGMELEYRQKLIEARKARRDS